jgi:ATP-dependent Lon protease
MGGEVLFIEATLLPGAKGLTLTGQLGEVMQESARAAYSYLWAHADELGFACSERFEKNGVHIHVPAGATPKDGPSAGVAIVSALASLCSGRPVRSDTAMTGEITLSGLVFPIGGIKGKILAAQRAGIKHVVLPKRNEPDYTEIMKESRDVLRDLTVTFVERIDQLLAETLTPGDGGQPRCDPDKPEIVKTPAAPEPVGSGAEVRVKGRPQLQ